MLAWRFLFLGREARRGRNADSAPVGVISSLAHPGGIVSPSIDIHHHKIRTTASLAAVFPDRDPHQHDGPHIIETDLSTNWAKNSCCVLPLLWPDSEEEWTTFLGSKGLVRGAESVEYLTS
jgi:hypothetical protein